MTEIIASLLGGLVGGLFTFLGVKMTINYEEKKRKVAEAEKQKEKEEQAFQNRPRLDVKTFKDIAPYKSTTKSDIDILLVHIDDFKDGGRAVFYYDEKTVDPSQWVCVEYTLKNTGNTIIDHIYFSTNLVKNTSLFNILKNENKMCFENHFLNYSAILDRRIKPLETIKVRVCYISDKVIISNIGSAPITVWLADENKRWWSQALFAPTDKIYDSNRTTAKEWKDNTDESKAIECFKDPMMW